jgi:hypothetical protein
LKNRIAIGYIASLIVAASLLTVIFFQILGSFATTSKDIVYAWLLLGFWTFVITIIPTAILIYFAERKGWRNVLVYLGLGAVLGLPIGLWFEFQFMLECAAIGAAAGLTYWLISGRKAGLRPQ